jgi:hypothetical protein
MSGYVARVRHDESPGGDVGLDPGERDLVIYAKTLNTEQIWLLNSPDLGTIRFCRDIGWLDGLVSLEQMIAHLGRTRNPVLRRQYTALWLRQQCTKFRMGLL